MVTALEAGSLGKRLTGAAIAALTAPQKPAGLVVYNTTTDKLQISDGSAFADVDAAALAAVVAAAALKLSLTGGTMSGPIAMGASKITGLAKGTAAGDAIARQQVQSGEFQLTGSYHDLTFPTAFGVAPQVVVTPIASGGTFYLTNVTTSGCRVVLDSGIAPVYVAWVAVGN